MAASPCADTRSLSHSSHYSESDFRPSTLALPVFALLRTALTVNIMQAQTVALRLCNPGTHDGSETWGRCGRTSRRRR